MEEQWVFIRGYEGRYLISNIGIVKSVVNGKDIILKTQKDKDNYVIVKLRDEAQKQYTYGIHRLVAKHFIPMIEGKDQVNHIDENKDNNTVYNLEWCDRSENMKHAYSHGLRKPKKKRIYCTTNGVVYDSISEASVELNISRAAINTILKGECYSMKGLHFEECS